MIVTHALTAASDALTLVAATVLTSGLVYLGIAAGCLAFVCAVLVVRLGR